MNVTPRPKQFYIYMMDVDALRAVQTSGPTTPSTCLLRAGPFYQFRPKMRVREEDTKNK